MDRSSRTAAHEEQRTSRIARLLAVLASLVALVALLAAVALPVNQLTQPGGAVRVRLADPDLLGRISVQGLAPGSWVELGSSADTVAYHVFTLPWWLRLLTEVPSAVSLLAVGLGALLLGRLLTSVGSGRPFDRRNPRRLRQLALLVAIGATGAQLLDWTAAAAVLRHVDMDRADAPILASASVSPVPLAIAGLLLVAADAFRRGRELADDVEGLV